MRCTTRSRPTRRRTEAGRRTPTWGRAGRVAAASHDVTEKQVLEHVRGQELVGEESTGGLTASTPTATPAAYSGACGHETCRRPRRRKRRKTGGEAAERDGGSGQRPTRRTGSTRAIVLDARAVRTRSFYWPSFGHSPDGDPPRVLHAPAVDLKDGVLTERELEVLRLLAAATPTVRSESGSTSRRAQRVPSHEHPAQVERQESCGAHRSTRVGSASSTAEPRGELV